MRLYVKRYISACIPYLYGKRKGGKQEGFLNLIPKSNVPFTTVHIDHLRPFQSTKRRNKHIVVVVDRFTKAVFLKAVRSTDAKAVIEYIRDFFYVFGVPESIVTDRGTVFTVFRCEHFCEQNSIKHVNVAVAIPRANGKVERLNRPVMEALLVVAYERDWYEILQVQFSINNMINSSTGSTPSQLLLDYTLRGGDDTALRDAF